MVTEPDWVDSLILFLSDVSDVLVELIAALVVSFL